jgi:hypothetical protein
LLRLIDKFDVARREQVGRARIVLGEFLHSTQSGGSSCQE